MQQPLLHHGGGAHQEIAEQMRRNIGALADLFREHAVAFRALDQRGEAAFRQPGGLIVRDVAHHFGVAAPDQHVGHRLADVFAPGESQQMRLPLVLANSTSSVSVQPRRTSSAPGPPLRCRHRARADGSGRPAHCQRRDRMRHLGARLGLDLDDQPAQHIVEQPDVIFVEVSRAIDEQIGDALEVAARLSCEPCWMTCSSSGISDADADIRTILPARSIRPHTVSKLNGLRERTVSQTCPGTGQAWTSSFSCSCTQASNRYIPRVLTDRL